MRAKTVPSKWLESDGRRLDCGPYMSGALEARVHLGRHRTMPLHDVTAGGVDGIFHAGRIKRLWVNDERYGRRFLSSTDILQADLSNLPLISIRAVAENPKLPISAGWTLITRSGTVGRMAYARPDMEGLACSEHVLRVVPDPAKIPPGYLYAYLSSKFGVPLIVGGTYGAIIQHIEPEHVANLPVPRLSADVEKAVHDLVVSAADARATAVALLNQSAKQLVTVLGMPAPYPAYVYQRPWVAATPASELTSRADAFYYAPLNADARNAFDTAAGELVPLSEKANVFIPGIFKRSYTHDQRFGVPYVTGADVFQLAPTSAQYLVRRIANDLALIIREGMILIQEAGQLGGLLGRSVLVGTYLDGFACSNNMVRVVAKDPADVGYLFAVLASEYGVRLISREAAGSSIPHLEVGRIRQLKIPWASKADRDGIGAWVVEAQRLRDLACDSDSHARKLIADAIHGESP